LLAVVIITISLVVVATVQFIRTGVIFARPRLCVSAETPAAAPRRDRRRSSGTAASAAALHATQDTGRGNRMASWIKLSLNFLQVVGGFESTYAMVWPRQFGTFIRFFTGIASADFISLVPVACVGSSFNYYTKFNLIVIVVLIVNAVMGLAYSTAAHRPASRVSRGVRSRALYVWTGFNFLSYITVCTTLFRALPCESFDDNTTLLIADYGISCRTPQYAVYRTLALIGTVLYAFGLPIIFLCLLLTTPAVADEAEFDPLAFLRSSYRKDRAFTEPLVFVYKISVAGVLVFVMRGSYAQIVLGIIIATVWAVTFAGRSIMAMLLPPRDTPRLSPTTA